MCSGWGLASRQRGAGESPPALPLRAAPAQPSKDAVPLGVRQTPESPNRSDRSDRGLRGMPADTQGLRDAERGSAQLPSVPTSWIDLSVTHKLRLAPAQP